MSRSILLVEDEALLAWVLVEELQDAEFEVRLATSGHEGLSVIESGASFHLLLTDIRMPGPDGWALARRARQLNPELPVIYMTGDSAADHLRDGVPGSALLPKPFHCASLLQAVAVHFT
jgi:CheY-like chemotaxis protein